MSKIIKTYAIYALLAAAFMIPSFLSNQVAAQSVAATPCDPDYFDSLKSRAWLEAQREITQNQNLIYKPDSVLQYTCFDLQLAELADHASDMFSESPRWGGAAVGLAGPLTGLVSASMNSYVTTNFKIGGGNLLGDRASFGSSMKAAVVPTDSYNCDVMNRVWMEAKCMDFIQDPNTDGFYTFDYYASADDMRQLPIACTKPFGLNTWDGNITKSTTGWARDLVNPFIEELMFQKGTDVACSHTEPVPTGVQVYSTAGTVFEEKVCIAPGCYYDKVTSKCIP